MHPVDDARRDTRTLGQRTADAVAATVGSWPFILIQTALLSLWIFANVSWLLHRHWDPYPFILLNLVLSFQAAYTGPIVMMSQNRADQRDRELAHHDYAVNCRALERLEQIVARLESDAAQWRCAQYDCLRRGGM